MSTKQLYEKTSEGMKEVSPLVAIEDIYSKLSDTPLEALVSLYNHVKCEWKGDVANTRRTVPLFLRRSGLFITYNNGTKYITEFFSAGTDQITTEDWVKDSNWTPVPDEDYISAGVKPGVGTIGYEQLSDNLKQMFREKVNVTNFPDDEDIASVDNMLKLKDREVNTANFQSKGYVILRKNLRLVNGVVKNVLTQNMINKPDTIYEIRYDFDLNGETINIPDNCILKFEGGYIKNGKIIGKNTCLLANKNTIFYNIYIDGNWNVQDIYSIWFDLIPDNTNIDNKENLQNLVRLSSEDIKNNIYVEGGSFYSSKKDGLLNLRNNTDVYFSNASINILDNDDIRESIIQVNDKTNVNLFNVKLVGDFKTHKFSSGKSDEWNHGIKISGSSNVNVINANVSYCVGDGIDVIDSYEARNSCKNIIIKDCVLDNNGRQGMSIESGDNVLVDHCVITNTSRIKRVYPGSAIDIEPWRETDLNNIHISHCEMYNNASSINVHLAFLDEPDKDRNILIEDCVFNDRALLSYASSITFRNIVFSKPQAQDGILFRKVNNCTFDNTPGIYKQISDATFSNSTIENCNMNMESDSVFSLGTVSDINIQNCKLKYYIRSLSGQNYIRNSTVDVTCDTVENDEATCLRFENSTVSTNTCRGKGEFRNCVLNSGIYFFKSIDNCILQFNNQSRLIWEDNAEIINSAINNKDNAFMLEDRSVNKDSTITITQSSFKSRNISTSNVKDNNIILNKGIYDIKNITPTLNTGTVFIDDNKVYIKTESQQLLIPYTLIGDTANRPTFKNNEDSGFQYFDSSLSKPIWWTGTKWIDATGADV